MPADETLSDKPSARHGDGDAPYWCYSIEKLPRPMWAIQYAGICRHSLESEARKYDKRCPTDCPHRATDEQAAGFYEIYSVLRKGPRAASDWLTEQRSKT